MRLWFLHSHPSPSNKVVMVNIQCYLFQCILLFLFFTCNFLFFTCTVLSTLPSDLSYSLIKKHKRPQKASFPARLKEISNQQQHLFVYPKLVSQVFSPIHFIQRMLGMGTQPPCSHLSSSPHFSSVFDFQLFTPQIFELKKRRSMPPLSPRHELPHSSCSWRLHWLWCLCWNLSWWCIGDDWCIHSDPGSAFCSGQKFSAGCNSFSRNHFSQVRNSLLSMNRWLIFFTMVFGAFFNKKPVLKYVGSVESNIFFWACPKGDRTWLKIFQVKVSTVHNFRVFMFWSASNWDFGLSLPSRGHMTDRYSLKGSQFQQPLLEFSGACEGCGELKASSPRNEVF